MLPVVEDVARLPQIILVPLPNRPRDLNDRPRLCEAHVDTGIDLGTWPVPLAAVVSHLAQDPEGCEVLRAAAIEPWFTVIGTHRGHRREAVAVVAGQRVVETAIGAWWRQIQAPSAADAAGFAIRSPA